MRVCERAGSANSTRAADESECGPARVSLSLGLNFLDRKFVENYIVLHIDITTAASDLKSQLAISARQNFGRVSLLEHTIGFWTVLLDLP